MSVWDHRIVIHFNCGEVKEKIMSESTKKMEPHFSNRPEIAVELSKGIASRKNAECFVTDMLISLSDELEAEYGRLLIQFVEDKLVPWQLNHNLF